MNLSAKTTQDQEVLGKAGKESTGRRSAEVPCSVSRSERRTDGKAVLIASRATLIPPDGIPGLVEVKPSLAPALDTGAGAEEKQIENHSLVVSVRRED